MRARSAAFLTEVKLWVAPGAVKAHITDAVYLGTARPHPSEPLSVGLDQNFPNNYLIHKFTRLAIQRAFNRRAGPRRARS